MIDYQPNEAKPAPERDDGLFDCPACGLPAEVTDRSTLDGVPAPVEHVKLVCVSRHRYTLPIDRLPISPVPSHADGTGMPQRR